jgi:protein-S-isoprenylcysteine O-methyltransferase Ste14
MAAGTKKWSSVVLIYNIVAPLVVFPALVLALAGDWRWIEGWVFGLWMAAMVIYNVAYLYLKDPALLTERSKLSGSSNQKGWDRYALPLVLLLAVAWLVIQPLDAKRFAWSPPFPVWLKVLGGLALLPAIYLIERTTMENTFLSARVRIQDDRKQQVISTGVYAFVRHPLYLGCLLMMLGAPLLLGSVWGLIITLIGSMVLIARIFGEEKMLASELEGYEEYKHKVKYRLVPFLW